MADKQIKIKAVLDNADFDNQIQNLEQKLSKLQKASGTLDPQSKAGQYAARTYEDFRKETISDVQKKYDVNERSLERLNKALDQQKRKYEEIQKLKEQNLEYDKEQEKILESRIQKLQQASQKRVVDLGEQQKILQQYGVQPQGQDGRGGFGGMMQNMGEMLRPLMKYLAPALIASQAGQVWQEFTYAPGLTQARAGAMAETIAGKNISALRTGDKFEEQMFYSEAQQRAAKEALERNISQRKQDRITKYLIGGAAAVGTVGLMATGAGAIAAPLLASSGVATTGTALGGAMALSSAAPMALKGAAVAGSAAYGYGAVQKGGWDRLKANIFGTFSDTYQEKYNTLTNQIGVEEYERRVRAAKQLTPLQKQQLDYFQQNRGNFLNYQRMTKASDEEMLDNLRSAGRIGFVEQDVFQATQGMAQAGGSSDLLRSGGLTAMQSQRMGLTNAAQIMGGISSIIGGGAETTERKFIEMLAEGTEIGLIASKLPQETRAFASVVTQFAKQNNIEDVGRLAADIAASLSGFMVDKEAPSIADIQAASAAESRYQKITSQTGGPRGLLQWSSLMNSEEIQGIEDARERGQIANMIMRSPEAQLLQDNFLSQYLAKMLTGGDFEKYREYIKKIKGESAVTGKNARELRKQFKEKYGGGDLKELLKKPKEDYTDEEAKQVEQLKDDFARYMLALGYTNADLVDPSNMKEAIATVSRTLGMGEEAPEWLKRSVKGKFSGKSLTEKMNRINKLDDEIQLLSTMSSGVYKSPEAQAEALESLIKERNVLQGEIEESGLGTAGEKSKLTIGRAREAFLNRFEEVMERVGEIGVSISQEDASTMNQYVQSNLDFVKSLKKDGPEAVRILTEMADQIARMANRGVLPEENEETDPNKVTQENNIEAPKGTAFRGSKGRFY